MDWECHYLVPGTEMHRDPGCTDAYNALLKGEKWWVALPKDLDDYGHDLKCDPKCSEDQKLNHTTITGAWNMYILPQIRSCNLIIPALAKCNKSISLQRLDFLWSQSHFRYPETRGFDLHAKLCWPFCLQSRRNDRCW